MNNRQRVSLVHIADIITRGLQIGSGGNNVIPEINTSAWKNPQMKSDILEEWIDDLDEEFDKARSFFSIRAA